MVQQRYYLINNNNNKHRMIQKVQDHLLEQQNMSHPNYFQVNQYRKSKEKREDGFVERYTDLSIRQLYRADYWAFGCVIYQMLSGKSPFKAPTDYLIFQKIKNLEYTMPDNFPEVAKDIIRRLLVKNPRERLGAGGKIDDIKQHPFFENIDWNNLFIEPSPYAYLREKLAEELRKNPPPQVDDVWFNQDENDPFGDPQQQQSYPPSTYSPPHHHRHHLSQQSSLTRISSSSNKEDKHVVERIGEQSHPLW